MVRAEKHHFVTVGFVGRHSLVDYWRAGDLQEALMRKENRSVVFADDGLPHYWKARFYFFEQLSPMHLYAVGQTTTIKIGESHGSIGFQHIFLPVKCLCVELRFICFSTCFHYNRRMSVCVHLSFF